VLIERKSDVSNSPSDGLAFGAIEIVAVAIKFARASGKAVFIGPESQDTGEVVFPRKWLVVEDVKV